MRSNELKLYGLSGLGLLIGSFGVALANASFRRAIRDTISAITHGPHHLDRWNDAAQLELAHIQETLRELRAALENVQSPDAPAQI